MITLLRQRSFALLWVGGLISLMGDRVLAVSLPFYVYQESGSTLMTALFVAAKMFPRLLLGSFAGVLVDRWDRKKVMAITSLGQGIIILPMLWVDSNKLWIIYMIILFQTALAVFLSPAEHALLPQLVEKNQLLYANALNAMNNNIARLIGPLFGVLILSLFGLQGVVVFDSLTFLVAAGLISWIRLPDQSIPSLSPVIQQGKGRLMREWSEGIDLIRRDQPVAVLIMTVVLFSFAGVTLDPLAVPFVVDVVGAGSNIYGYLMTIQAIGGLTGGMIAGRLGLRLPLVYIYGWGTVAVGLLQLFRYNIVTLPVVFATALLIGLPAAMLAAALDTLFQQMVPNSHLGRVVGAVETLISFISLFGVLGMAGALGNLLGIVPVLNFSAVLTVIAGVLALLFLPVDKKITR